MELRNECLVQVERIDPTEWAHNQVAAAYLATEDSLLILWPQAAGLLKFPSLSFSLSVPLPPNCSLALMRLVATSYSCQCTCFSSSVGLWLSRLGNLFTWSVLTLCKLQVSILSVSWDDCLWYETRSFIIGPYKIYFTTRLCVYIGLCKIYFATRMCVLVGEIFCCVCVFVMCWLGRYFLVGKIPSWLNFLAAECLAFLPLPLSLPPISTVHYYKFVYNPDRNPLFRFSYRDERYQNNTF